MQCAKIFPFSTGLCLVCSVLYMGRGSSSQTGENSLLVLCWPSNRAFITWDQWPLINRTGQDTRDLGQYLIGVELSSPSPPIIRHHRHLLCLLCLSLYLTLRYCYACCLLEALCPIVFPFPFAPFSPSHFSFLISPSHVGSGRT